MSEKAEPQGSDSTGSGMRTATALEGLSFVDENKMHHDFRRLKGNQMYFVDHCTFYEKNGARGEKRIFALTPTAFFVLDFAGTMERASPYELITAMYQKKTKDKKILSFNSTEYHLLLKIPTEIDCHISFVNANSFQNCTHVLATLLQARRGAPFSVKEIPSDKEIEFFCNEIRREGYYTPREVAEINRQRFHFDAFICSARSHIMELLSRLEATKAQITTHENEVEDLRKQGIDEKSIRQRKVKLEEKQVRLHKQMSQKHDECERVLDTVKELQEKLTALSGNKEALVEKGVAEMKAKLNKKQEGTVALRRSAQQKEKHAVVESVVAYKKELHAAWASVTDEKRRSIVSQIEASFLELERELEALYRLEKFLATINGKLQVQNDLISAQNLEKEKFINEREKRVVLSRNAAAAGEGGNILDDPLINLSAPPAVAAIAVDDLLENVTADEDLL
ncbi:hypothetical protein TcBrA4_0107040 [Trypanosoma cruzi]|nr:hypothetical protein TcBrA4_0107040 [Trypanosoma cruzi]